MKHFLCKSCGNLVAMVNDSGKRMSCCRDEVTELTPRWDGQGGEKHIPSVKRDGEHITVSVSHPMEKDHAIGWVCLVTDRGSQRKELRERGKAEVDFYLEPGEKLISAFAYCNLHGLWVTQIKEG